MTDLVERLREMRPDFIQESHAITHEAADEIEQLRSALLTCVEEIEENLEWEGRLTSFKAAAERGREALGTTKDCAAMGKTNPSDADKNWKIGLTAVANVIDYEGLGRFSAQLVRDAADEIERLRADNERLRNVEKTARQFMLEVSHAMQTGPGWYTKGEDGLRQQVYRWIDNMRKALSPQEQNDGF